MSTSHVTNSKTSPPVHAADLLRTKEVASLYGIPEGTLRYYRSKGKGPTSARIEGRIVYRRADVDAWIAAAFDKTAGGDGQ